MGSLLIRLVTAILNWNDSIPLLLRFVIICLKGSESLINDIDYC